MPKFVIFTWLFSPRRIFLAARSRVVVGIKIIHSTGNFCTHAKQCAACVTSNDYNAIFTNLIETNKTCIGNLHLPILLYRILYRNFTNAYLQSALTTEQKEALVS